MENKINVFQLNNFNPKFDMSQIGVDGNLEDLYIFPSFCDVHVHFREPGFSYKETIKTGSRAAAHGGYTAVCTMPNLKPVPDTKENLDVQMDIIKKDSLINIYPYASITIEEKGERVTNMDELSQAIAFSDDGRGVQSSDIMKSAMENAKRLDKIIVAHCEDNSLLNGGYIHKGDYAQKNNHLGICSESEWFQIKRDIELCEQVGCKYHVCHISTKESVDIIRRAKKRGVDITCETAPHYLVFDENDLKEDGKWKMNPPLRKKEDREALIKGIQDGTIDMIATDHAPHSLEEKSKGLKDSLFGIVGIETAFPVLYTKLVKTNIISLNKLIELISINPRKRFSIPLNNDYTIWNLNEEYHIDPKWFLSKGKSTPFENMLVFGKCLLTVCNGKEVYKLETR